MSKVNPEEFMEVAITDEGYNEYFYWVKTDDEDDAVEAAVKKHEELGRPDYIDDFDEGVFPLAYEPVIIDNQPVAVVITELED